MTSLVSQTNITIILGVNYLQCTITCSYIFNTYHILYVYMYNHCRWLCLATLLANGTHQPSRWPWLWQLQRSWPSIHLRKDILVGGWPTPLKNMTNRQLGLMTFPNCSWKVIKTMFQSPPTSANYRWLLWSFMKLKIIQSCLKPPTSMQIFGWACDDTKW